MKANLLADLCASLGTNLYAHLPIIFCVVILFSMQLGCSLFQKPFADVMSEISSTAVPTELVVVPTGSFSAPIASGLQTGEWTAKFQYQNGAGDTVTWLLDFSVSADGKQVTDPTVYHYTGEYSSDTEITVLWGLQPADIKDDAFELSFSEFSGYVSHTYTFKGSFVSAAQAEGTMETGDSTYAWTAKPGPKDELLQKIQAPSMPAAAATSDLVQTATPGVQPEEILPTPSPAAQLEPSKILDVWFNQDSTSPTLVYYAFIVENPDPDNALKESQFQAVAYDTSGTVLATSDISVYALMPGEQFGVSGIGPLIVPENTTVEKVEILQSHAGEPVQFDFSGSPFVVEKEKYYPDEYSPLATGVIHSPLEGDISNVSVSALAYDAAGKIVGAGYYMFQNYLAFGGSIPVAVNLKVFGEVDRVRLYPSISVGSGFYDATMPDLPHLKVAGFSQDQYGQVNYAFIVENPSATQPYQYLSYQVGLYDEAGNVLQAVSSQINLIFPGELQAGASTAGIPKGTKVARIEVQVIPPSDVYDSMGLANAGLTSNPLTADQVTFLPGQYDAKVTGFVKNAYSKEVRANVVVVAYDEAGSIVGGGMTSINSIPAGGKAAVDVPLYLAVTPARVELYPSIQGFMTP